MHCVVLADLAASISQHGPSLRQVGSPIATDSILRYWTAARSRHELWHRAMARYRDAKNAGDYRQLRDWWQEHGVLLEEILVSELLSRVVAAVTSVSGTSKSDCEIPNNESLSAVTHGVFVAQLEASNRVATIILEASGSRIQDTVRLNRLRFGVQRWTDWLLAGIGCGKDELQKYAIDISRTTSFSKELHESASDGHRDMMTLMMNTSMRDMLARRTRESAALPQANRDVAIAAMGLFRPELFDGFGVPKSAWLTRLQRDVPFIATAHPV